MSKTCRSCCQSSCGTICLSVSDACNGLGFVPSNVTLSKAGVAVATAAYPGKGQLCFPISAPGAAGEYQLTAAAQGYAPKTISLGAVACTGKNVTATTMALSPADGLYQVTVLSCPYIGQVPLGGITVRGQDGAIGISDQYGHANLSTPPNQDAYTVTAIGVGGYEDTSATGPVRQCSGVDGIAMLPAPGYHCWLCPYPLPDTLTLVDSLYGSVDLNWSTSVAGAPGGVGWVGTTSGTTPATGQGCGAYPALPVTLTYTLLADPSVNNSPTVRVSATYAGSQSPPPRVPPEVDFHPSLACCPQLAMKGANPANQSQFLALYGCQAATVTITDGSGCGGGGGGGGGTVGPIPPPGTTTLGATAPTVTTTGSTASDATAGPAPGGSSWDAPTPAVTTTTTTGGGGGDTGGGGTSSPCCPGVPIPTQIDLNDGHGGIALRWVAAGNYWEAYALRFAAIAQFDCSKDFLIRPNETIAVRHRLTCTAGPTWTLEVGVPACGPGAAYPFATSDATSDRWPGIQTFTAQIPPESCSPLSLAVTIPPTGASAQVYGAGVGNSLGTGGGAIALTVTGAVGGITSGTAGTGGPGGGANVAATPTAAASATTTAPAVASAGARTDSATGPTTAGAAAGAGTPTVTATASASASPAAAPTAWAAVTPGVSAGANGTASPAAAPETWAANGAAVTINNATCVWNITVQGFINYGTQAAVQAVPDRTVTVTWQGNTLGSAVADANGQVSIPITIPDGYVDGLFVATDQCGTLGPMTKNCKDAPFSDTIYDSISATFLMEGCGSGDPGDNGAFAITGTGGYSTTYPRGNNNPLNIFVPFYGTFGYTYSSNLFNSVSGSYSYGACTATGPTLTLSRKTVSHTFVVQDAANNRLAGAAVSISGSGGESASGTTDSSGIAVLSLLAATPGCPQTYTVSLAGHTTATGSLTYFPPDTYFVTLT